MLAGSISTGSWWEGFLGIVFWVPWSWLCPWRCGHSNPDSNKHFTFIMMLKFLCIPHNLLITRTWLQGENNLCILTVGLHILISPRQFRFNPCHRASRNWPLPEPTWKCWSIWGFLSWDPKLSHWVYNITNKQQQQQKVSINKVRNQFTKRKE